MKLLTSAILSLTLASTSFASEETVTVTGSRITPGPSPSSFPGGVRGSRATLEQKQRFGEGEEGGSSASVMSNTKLMLLVIEQFGDTVNELAQKEAWVELKITVTTAAGDKYEVELKAGYGKKEITSRKKL